METGYITGMFASRTFAVFLAGTLIALAPACVTQPTARDPMGAWGGDHIVLSVTADGATLEYDCAAGTIDGAVTPDAEGWFRVLGTHNIGHGGPARQDEVPDRHPASYEGRITGDSMTLTVTLTDTGTPVGTFGLMRGAASRIVRCL
jgi:hypothetical protein